ncbi:Xaa-Pro dipeptidase [Bosea sp. 62]|uniref:M24 family metallopeptidase n=1 Tax=unclassified Bosea (in: a-proteobacteria) TaxID=2653178 RepID=UPI0012569CD2|nr:MULTISPECIES: Xaa-Pro peptidase family protein [unclassified Bosea (in: a-proteobacteria)]CAD5257062.1 Xaa-Pro dipeptidase [Bosea sp. 46]CAD5261509.1 Xaa-Pro dipeptidase [Bosea sp. 21B]CAD5279075.1 Xaa-Pro dipeptidase [Bosea sp. 7B]VVT58491.1 Xaa-Pro dipeptidase [Bosea sp. EC-HK365B]VXB54988.1 Xaa-Pro dipeptidase [Bosea sp. 29B]
MSPLFPREEFAGRVAQARAAMAEVDAELLLVDHAEFLAWLTGYTVSETMYRAAFLPREGEPWFVLRALDAGPCRDACWFADIVGFADAAEPHEVMAGEIRRRGFAQAAIGADHASYGFIAAARERFAGLLPEARFVDLPRASDLLRAVKSPAEIALIAQASRIADKAMAAIAAQARPGFSPRAAAAIAAACFLENGADTGETGPILPGVGDHEFLHGVMTGRPLAEGDILHVELIPKVRNYGARLMRPVLIGADRRGLAPLAARLVALQDKQFATMRPGALACEVDAVLREAVLAEGLRPVYDNVTGYTLGLYGRTPRTSDFSRVFLPNARWRLEQGMVFHMYVSAGGLGFSETIVVEAEGCRRLTAAPRKLLTDRID